MKEDIAEEERRPRLPAAERASESRPPGGPSPSEIASELRRFHVGSPTKSAAPSIDGFRSAAIEALEVDRAAIDASAALVESEGEVGDEDAEDLEAASVISLLRLATRRRLAPRRDGFLIEVRDLARRLRNVLDVERSKDESRKPEHLEQAVSSVAAEHLDASKLSAVIGPARGTRRLGEAEKRRIQAALDVLESFAFAPGDPVLRILHAGALEPESLAGVRCESSDDPAGAALEIFEAESARFVDVFRATRVARLVVDNAFDERQHGPWLDGFAPDGFRGEEKLLLPVVVAIETAERLEESGLRSFSRLLLSGRPVHVVVITSPRRAPRVAPGAGSRERLEPGYVAMGHRTAFAQQSSAGNPAHLLRGLLASLDHARPALHVLDTAQGPADALAAEAALCSRAHPCFRYDPAAGSSWAGRLDFSGNPAPESVWPVRTLSCERPDGKVEELSLAVTFADYLLGDSATSAHFRPVPAGCPENHLAPLADWLELEEDEALLRIPWVWAIDPGGDLHKLAITRRLAMVSRERADSWHTLQELAGVRNEYVTEAVQRARSESEAAAAAERERLVAEYTEQLETAKRASVEAAMQNLARNLLDLDPAAIPAATPTADEPPVRGDVDASTARGGAAAKGSPPRREAATASGTAAPPEGTPAPSESAPAAANGEDEELGEPWIDTPLCTSCNDCTAINSALFVYDSNKQAIIGDLSQGTFAQVVRAAEKCPARCIHPGAPWNGDEPALEGLIRRAKPFQ